jgi:voltage-gated potassium channel
MRRVVKRVLAAPFQPLVTLPIVRRVAFHGRRMGAGLDLHFFRTLLFSLLGFVVLASALVSLLEASKRSLRGFGDSLYWAVTTVIGSGDASYVESPGGQLIGWLLAFFGVAIVAALTAAIVGFVIDFLLKEGQGMGAAGYQDHIVVCGWNPTARELIDELSGDEFPSKIVLLHEAEHNPGGMGVYFVRGDVTSAEDLRRAGIEEATAAIVFPADTSNDADMRSILTVLAIESLAPHVRTVVEVNNPRHVEHFERAKADEILVTSRLASRLLARSALYPGLASLVTDIVSGGEGSQLYRVALPDAYTDLTPDEVSARLRSEHRATLLAVTRDGTRVTNPPADFRLTAGDGAVVIAESLDGLVPDS